jgi:hypothetical protein
MQEALIHELAAATLALPGRLRLDVRQNLRLVITLILLAGLLLEPQSLVEGVVQLGVRVGNFLLANERPTKPSVLWPQEQHAATRKTYSNLSQRPFLDR